MVQEKHLNSKGRRLSSRSPGVLSLQHLRLVPGLVFSLLLVHMLASTIYKAPSSERQTVTLLISHTSQREHIGTLIKGTGAAGADPQLAAGQQLAGTQQQFAGVQAKQQQPTATRHKAKARPVTAIPWRSLAHLDGSTAGDAMAAAAAYLVSAFLDTRPMRTKQRPRLAVITVSHKAQDSSAWRCLISQKRGASSSQHQGSIISEIGVVNNEPFFNYLAVTYFCELPAALDGSLNSTGKLEDQLSLTLVHANHTSADLLSPRDAAWVPVLQIPQTPDSWLPEYKAGNGSIAVCTSALHTDSYAATLVEWAEFQRLMGANQVTVYSFNPGPLIKPLLDYYHNEGFFEVFEWIIPASILNNKTQECKLPWFHPSEHRIQYGSPNCTYHQDNYRIAHWGQTAALQDCVYRAMAAGHRWAAILDLDEYILPRRAAPNMTWLAMLKEASGGGEPHAEYQIQGVKLCSGCTHQLHTWEQQQYSKAPTYSVAVAPTAATPGVCLHPMVGFNHILWSTVVSSDRDYIKSIVAPLAVEHAAVHSTRMFSGYSLTGSAIARVPPQLAIKLHDRMHDIHQGQTTFAAKMLPLLKQHADAATGRAAGDGLMPAYPSDGSCSVCGSVAAGGQLSVDYSLCNQVGRQLQQQIGSTLHSMRQAGVFDVWLTANQSIANLYGGYEFKKWAPPS